MNKRPLHILAALSLASTLLVACNSSTTATATYTIGGTVSGLAAGQSVTLLNNGGDGYVATADGNFTFATALTSGASYSVTVGTQPLGQKCSVTNGSGTVSSANVTNVSVQCLDLGLTVLHDFGSTSSGDGNNPFSNGGLVMDAAGNVYGTTKSGGTNNLGTVFKIDTSGNETVLYSFNGVSDGQLPSSGLILDGNGYLYGTTQNSGPNGAGTVFKIATDGSGFQVLHSFGAAGDGALPYGRLLLANGVLYGTTSAGGTHTQGTVFKIGTNGSGYSVIYNFGDISNDGNNPQAGLIMDASGNLYGTTSQGGVNSTGTVFKIGTGGTETKLHDFGGSGSNDGTHPYADLVMDGNGNLYGTTDSGFGTSSYGTVFKLDTSGNNYQVLYAFTSGSSDGATPDAGLLLSNGVLYGSNTDGGANTYGTLFKINTNGTGYSTLHSLTSADGYTSYTDLIMDANGNLYGANSYGGANSTGTVFRYVLP